jgi:hypothetical protein
LNFANKIKNKLFSEKTIFSSTISDFIKDRNNKDKNVFEENSEDEDNEKEYKDEENEKDKKQMKLKNFLDIFKFIFNILKYFFVLIIFTIYFIGSVKYFLLNMDIAFFEEKVRNNKLANHLEKTNYGIYNQKEILNILGRSEIEIEYLYNDNNTKWNNIDFRYKLGKENTKPKFLFFHTPRLDFKMFDVAYDEDINDDSWMVSLISNIFQKNPVVLDLFNYNIEDKKFIKKISMFERLKEIYLRRKEKHIISNDEINKIRIDIFKYKFKDDKSFIRKRYKEYLSQIEKYAIILISEKLDLPKFDKNRKIQLNKFQLIPIIDIVILFILLKIIINKYI